MAALNRQKIVEAAIHLLDRVGFEALTTRLLAHELGVKQPALYWHFKNKRDLADAMAAAMLSPEEWPGPLTPGLSIHEWLPARAHALRAALLEHRDGALIHAGTSPEPETFTGLEFGVAALTKHGLSGAYALNALISVSRYTVGWVLEEQALSQRNETEGEHLLKAKESILRDAVSELRGLGATTRFDFGLRCLVNGLLEQRQPASASVAPLGPLVNATRSRKRVRPPKS